MNRTEPGKTGSQFTIAIIGGGFTGATLAAQLLRDGTASVVLIERGARVGRGVAYGTQCMGHLLNVPAGNMSAYADDAEHFLRWARQHRDPATTALDFVPRKVYGQYIDWLLRQELERHPERFKHIQDEAVAVAWVDGTAEIGLRSGQRVSADKVVLALGNFPPGDPRLPGKAAGSRRFVADPWAPGGLDEVAHDTSVLLLGTGLTSVDVAIALWSRDFVGTIHMFSRRGLLPQNHKATVPWPSYWNEKSPRTVRGLLRLMRTEIESAEERGSGWRAVVDSLRPVTTAVWRSLPRQERRRFLRHARPYWEVHRHRVAPEIGKVLASQMEKGQLCIHAGRISAYAEDNQGISVTYHDRKSKEAVQLRVEHLINCTGPEVDCRRMVNPLLTNLIDQKMARPDPLFLGLDTTEDGALINSQGEASDFLYTLGPSRKGSLWETIAVPELRVQVSELSKVLLMAEKAKSDLRSKNPEGQRPVESDQPL
jgi:uncharacterized NAD(P)/FAD-binding protein YdhS